MGILANYFWVALGGSLGTMARYWMSNAVARLVGETFPWGTLLINVLGSFVMVRYVHSAKWPSASQRGNAVVRHGRHLRWIHHLLGLQSTDIRFVARWREFALAGVYCRFGSVLSDCN